MNSSYLVIDPGLKKPAFNNFNQLVRNWKTPIQYLSASLFPNDFSGIIGQKFLGIIILGSHSNVSEQLPWHKRLSDFALTKCQQGTPVLGICFGHQLMAHAMGAKVIPNKMGHTHQGVRTPIISQNFLNFNIGESYSVFVSHSYEITDVPEHFITLAQSDICTHEIVASQKFPYIGIQGHPEASLEFIAEETSIPISETLINHAQIGGNQFLQKFKKLCEDFF